MDAATIQNIAQNVWSGLGPGYSERVYHNAFEVELRKRQLPYETERIIPVSYQGHNVGNVRADIIIDNKVVVELKSVSKITPQFRIQTQKYMELTGCDQGYLINFPTDKDVVDIEFFS